MVVNTEGAPVTAHREAIDLMVYPTANGSLSLFGFLHFLEIWIDVPLLGLGYPANLVRIYALTSFSRRLCFYLPPLSILPANANKAMESRYSAFNTTLDACSAE